MSMPRAMSAPNEHEDVSDKLLQALGQGAAARAGGHDLAFVSQPSKKRRRRRRISNHGWKFRLIQASSMEQHLLHQMLARGALLQQRELSPRRANILIPIKILRPHQPNREGEFYEPRPVKIMHIQWRRWLSEVLRPLQRC